MMVKDSLLVIIVDLAIKACREDRGGLSPFVVVVVVVLLPSFVSDRAFTFYLFRIVDRLSPCTHILSFLFFQHHFSFSAMTRWVVIGGQNPGIKEQR